MRRGRRLPFAVTAGERRWFAVALAVLVSLLAVDFALPPPLERARVVSPVVLDRDGAWLRAFATPDQKWRLAARLDEIDPEFLRRVVAVEDARFWLHPGVDPLALTRATASFLRRGEVTSGASTITMQLARLLEPRPRTPASKAIEILRALQIERRWSKREILAAYLTLAPYGGNLEGVRAASRAYFARDPQGLSDAEMALLIALPQAPEARRPDRRPEAARAGRDAILDLFVAKGLISARLGAEARAAAIPGRSPFPIRAEAAAERLARSHPGADVIVSTLDVRLQTELAALAREAVAGAGREVSAALVVVDIAAGEIRASIGGAGWDRAGGYLDMTRAPRSPGSTLKPFIYGLAFDDGIAAPGTLIDDAPQRFSGYMPENFDRRFHGQVRVSEALEHSLNLPAVALLEQVGAGRLEAVLTRAGAKPRLPSRGTAEPGLALALGGVGMTLEELATLYAGLGAGGEARPLALTPGPRWTHGSARLMSEKSAARILAILAQTPAPKGRAPAALAQDAPRIAFKTGTSYGFRDAWAVGVGAGHVVAVWVGRPDGAPRPGFAGRNAALPLLFDAFDRIRPAPGAAVAFAEPESAPAPGLARFDRDGAEAARTGPAILFPPDGAEVLVDRVGPASRGLSLSVRGGTEPVVWYAEGLPVPIETTSGRAIWRPSAAGFHEIQAVDGDGRRASVRVRIRAGG